MRSQMELVVHLELASNSDYIMSPVEHGIGCYIVFGPRSSEHGDDGENVQVAVNHL